MKKRLLALTLVLALCLGIVQAFAAEGDPTVPALSADVGPYHFQTVYTGEHYDDYEVYLMDQSDDWTGVKLAYMKEGLADAAGEALPAQLTAWRAENGAVMLSLSDPNGKAFTTSLPVSSLDWCLENLREPMPEPTVTATVGGVTLGMVQTRYYNLFYFRDQNLFLRNDGTGWKRLPDLPFTPSSRLLTDEIGTFVVSDEAAGVLYVSEDGLAWTRVDALGPADLETAGLYTTYEYALAKTDSGYLAARHIYERTHGMMGMSGGTWYEGSTKVYFLDENWKLTGSHDFGRLVEGINYDGVYAAGVSNSEGTRYGAVTVSGYDEAGKEIMATEPGIYNPSLGTTWHYSADGENWTTWKPGVLPPAPDALTLTFADGTVLALAPGDWLWGFDATEKNYYGEALSWVIPESMLDWAKSVDGQRVTASLNGIDCTLVAGYQERPMPIRYPILSLYPEGFPQIYWPKGYEALIRDTLAPGAAENMTLTVGELVLTGSVLNDSPVIGWPTDTAMTWSVGSVDPRGISKGTYLKLSIRYDMDDAYARDLSTVLSGNGSFPATVTLAGVTWPGKLTRRVHGDGGGYWFFFDPDDYGRFHTAMYIYQKKAQPTETDPAGTDPTGALEGVAAKFPNIKEYPGFADVDEGDWFYPYVKMCYETGLLVGTGEGHFSPKTKVTEAEAITLAARIHQILNGGDGVMPQAPADWAKITLTFADGVSRTFDRGYPGWGVGGRTFSSLYFNAEGGAFAGLDGQHVSITFEGGGPTFLGKVSVNSSQDHMGFTFLEDEDLPEETRPKWQDYYAALMAQVSHTDPKLWWAGTTYYLQTQGIGLYPTEDIACRADFVNDLDTVAHDLLDPINHIEDIPDDGYTVPVETVLDFYNAGILTGVDDYGTFAGVLGLTRAEMAAMAARLVRPELRIAFTPAEPEYRKYTLTELLSGHQDDNSHYLSADLFSFYRHDEEGSWAGEVFLRADGSILELPDGAHFQQYPNEFFDTHLVVLAKPDYTVSLYVDVTGVMDTETGEMVLPFDLWSDIVLTDNDQFITRKTGDVTEPWVLRDRAGKPVKELWGTADWQNYHEGLAIKWDQDSGRFGFVNADDQWVIPPAYGNSLGIFRGGYCVVYSYDPEGYVVIDKTGKIVLGPYGEMPGLGLDDRGDGLFRWSDFGQREGAWVSPDGTEIFNQYLFSDIYLKNGYFALTHSYLDKNFQYATPKLFDWTGPIGPDGSGFVGIGDKVYRIQFVND